MGMQVNHWDRVKRWALIGAGLGLLVSITRTIGDGVISAEDAGRFLGSPIGGAFWGAVAALIRNRFK